MEKDCYQYTDLSSEDALLAEQAQLLLVMSDAHKTLFKTKVTDTNSRYQISEHLAHTSEEVEKLQHSINYVLELMGKYSNIRCGESAFLQNQWFQRKYEQGSFFVHLFMSIQTHKGKQMPSVKVDGEIINEAVAGDYPAKLKEHESKKEKYFVDGELFYTEKQLYAAGVYYVIPFLIRRLKDNDVVYVSKLWSSITCFREGADYSDFLAQQGGLRSGKSRSKDKEKAYEMFVKHRLYEPSSKYPDVKPSNSSIAARIKELMPKRMKTSVETIEKKWVPEFLKRAHDIRENEWGSGN